MTSLIEDGLRLVTAEKRTADKPKRVLPLVSKAVGGVMPGIDVVKFSELEERDEMERFGRGKRVE